MDNNQPSTTTSLKIDSVAVHAGYNRNHVQGAMAPPISVASMYANKNATQLGNPYYSRFSNPSRDAFENAIAALEMGTHAVAFSSGSAAVLAVLSLLGRGDTILRADDLYAGSTTSIYTHIQRVDSNCVTFTDMNQLRSLLDKHKHNATMIWMENPSNPMLKVFDIREAVQLAKSTNGKTLCVVDNTLLSPALQRPLQLGADVSVNSVSKYIGGHSDLVMGVATTKNELLAAQLRSVQVNDGAVPSPFDCFLALRGVRTLPLRLGRQCENALYVAKLLEKHETVDHVFYPGLKSHPHHELAKSQADGFGAMVSFSVKGGKEKALNVLTKCKLITPAVSLGGVESVIEHPATMTHRTIEEGDRIAIGITDALLRMSIGIEDKIDIMNDLNQALD